MSTFSTYNSPIGLRHLGISYGEYAQLAFRTFTSPRTLVLLDTNVLALPFRFHSAARQGFFSLLRTPIDERRLFVPGWVSNEFFHNAFRSKPNEHGFAGGAKRTMASLPKSEHVKAVFSRAASNDDLDSLATKFSIPRSEVLNHLVSMASDWNEILGRVGKDLEPDLVHSELGVALHGCFLPLNFNEHCALVHAQAERRRANRLPPGLTDGGKSDSTRNGRDLGNADGDLALWLEVLDVAERLCSGPESERAYDNVVVLCEERKEDFLYTPRTRTREPIARPRASDTENNLQPRISLVDPRLVGEFESRVGHRNIAFLNMESIADGWLRSAISDPSASGIKEFVLALTQQKDSAQAAEKTNEDIPPVEQSAAGLSNENQVTESPPTSRATADELDASAASLAVPDGALRDEKAALAALPDGPFKEVIDDLNVHNWYVQNPAIVQLWPMTAPPDTNTGFLLGRAILQAADGSAWRAAKFLTSFANWALEDGDTYQAVLAGAAYEAFFDAKGALRTTPKAGGVDDVLAWMSKPRFARARSHFVDLLRAEREHFYWLPGQPLITVEVVVAGELVDGICIARDVVVRAPGYIDISLCRRKADEEWGQTFEKDGLRSLVSRQTLLPMTHVTLIFEPQAAEANRIMIAHEVYLEAALLQGPKPSQQITQATDGFCQSSEQDV
jgi:hypothetical protein